MPTGLYVGLSSGNVGIGTTGISGTSNAVNVTTSGAAGAITVLANGNVGIGTTNPQYALDVSNYTKLKTPNCQILGASCGGTLSDSVLLTGNPVTYYLLKYETVLYNALSLYNTSTKRITIPVSGLYYINATAIFSSGGGTGYYIYMVKNVDLGNSTTNGGALFAGTIASSIVDGSGYATVQCTATVPLNINDYINIYVAYEQGTVGGAYFRKGSSTTFTWANPVLNAYLISAM